MSEAAAPGPAVATSGLRGADDFEALVLRCQRRVYRVIRCMVRDDDAADTLTQECFLKAFRGWSRFDGRSSAETWLVSIALNLARDHVRSRRGRFWRRLVRLGTGTDPEERRDGSASPEEALGARETLERVFAVVDGLSPQQREVFLLRFVEEMTLSEIAVALGVSEGTVKTHLHRATSVLRQAIGVKP